MNAKAKPAPWTLRPMTMRDYPAVRRIWAKAEGICLVADDSRRGIALYLARNPGLCFVAASAGRVVGTVLCGHDGRRGILRHLAVVPAFQRRGIGRKLSERSLRALAGQGVRRCNVFVMDDNRPARGFWKHMGFGLVKYNYRTLQAAISRAPWELVPLD